MNRRTEHGGPEGKATTNPWKDLSNGINDKRNVEDRGRDGAGRIGTGDDAAKKMQPCIDSENGRECNDEPCAGRTGSNDEDGGNHEKPEDRVEKEELGTGYERPGQAGNPRGKVKPVLLCDVKAIRERKQPDPGPGRRRSSFSALTHSR